MQGPTVRCFTVLSRRSSLPLRFRLLNIVGESLQAVSVPVARFDEEAVRTAAMKETGLSDFGDPHFREGLLRLLESAETDADLHFIGRLAIREVLANALASRLLLMEARKRTPEIFERPLIPLSSCWVCHVRAPPSSTVCWPPIPRTAPYRFGNCYARYPTEVAPSAPLSRSSSPNRRAKTGSSAQAGPRPG
jgi:hypothetical protein